VGSFTTVNANKADDLAIDRRTDGVAEPATGAHRQSGDIWPWVNWGLALATVPAAATVMLFALGAVMSTDACSDGTCPGLGHGGIDFGVAFYGAPAVALIVILMSFFTAKRKGGIAVPLCGWALMVGDVAVMAATVAQRVAQ
jgi:hypothetical protein